MVGLTLICAISLCIYPIMPRYNMTPFFRDIENGSTYHDYTRMKAEAETLILEHITPGVSTRDEVQAFIEQTLFRWIIHFKTDSDVYLPHCDYYPHSQTCHVPESSVFFEETRWIIHFYFEEEILSSIRVELGLYGLQ